MAAAEDIHLIPIVGVLGDLLGEDLCPRLTRALLLVGVAELQDRLRVGANTVRDGGGDKGETDELLDGVHTASLEFTLF